MILTTLVVLGHSSRAIVNQITKYPFRESHNVGLYSYHIYRHFYCLLLLIYVWTYPGLKFEYPSHVQPLDHWRIWDCVRLWRRQWNCGSSCRKKLRQPQCVADVRMACDAAVVFCCWWWLVDYRAYDHQSTTSYRVITPMIAHIFHRGYKS